MKNRPKLLLTTHIENFTAVMEEMKSLNLDHYHEISEHKKHGIPLLPDYDRYILKERQGELLYVALRHAGKLVGYFIGFIAPGLHYKTCLTLVMDIVYIAKECRGQNALPLLINAVQAEAKRRGVRLMLAGYKENHKRFMPKILEECGMKPFDHVYSIWFD